MLSMFTLIVFDMLFECCRGDRRCFSFLSFKCHYRRSVECRREARGSYTESLCPRVCVRGKVAVWLNGQVDQRRHEKQTIPTEWHRRKAIYRYTRTLNTSTVPAYTHTGLLNEPCGLNRSSWVHFINVKMQFFYTRLSGILKQWWHSVPCQPRWCSGSERFDWLQR